MKKEAQTKPFKLLKFISMVFALIVLIFFIYSLINYSFLKNQINETLENQVEAYGYIAVFILGFLLEISPQPFASALVPYTQGLILGLDFKLLLVTILVTIILSSLTAYVLGIIYGKRLTIKLIGYENYDKYHGLFRRYGKMGMALIALTPLPYFPILAGLFKMNLKDFFIFAIVPRIIHVFFFGWILSLVF